MPGRGRGASPRTRLTPRLPTRTCAPQSPGVTTRTKSWGGDHPETWGGRGTGILWPEARIGSVTAGACGLVQGLVTTLAALVVTASQAPVRGRSGWVRSRGTDATSSAMRKARSLRSLVALFRPCAWPPGVAVEEAYIYLVGHRSGLVISGTRADRACRAYWCGGELNAEPDNPDRPSDA